MKWTMISLAIAGTVTYAVIFLAHVQTQRETKPAAVPEVVVGPEDFVRVDEVVATFDPPEVSKPENGFVQAAIGTVDPAPAWEGQAWTFGVGAYEEGRYEVAVPALEAAVDEKETSPYRHYLLGLAYRKVGQGDAAVSELTRSLELAPGTVRTLVALGRCQLDLGDTMAAREAVDVALEHDLAHADTWHVLGRIELDEGNLEPAAAAFRRAAELDPAHLWAQNNLGYVRILQERFDEALEPLLVAVEGGRDEAVFFNNLGVALERCDETTLAARAYGKAVLIGHGPAEESLGRVSEVLVARGESVPGLEELESLDGPTLVAQLRQMVAPEATATLLEGPEEQYAGFEDR